MISSFVNFSSLLTFVFSLPGRTDFAAFFRLSCPAIWPGFVSKLSARFYHSHRNSRKLLEVNKKEMERVKGIEPSSQAWEARILPLNHTRVQSLVSVAGTPKSLLRTDFRDLILSAEMQLGATRRSLRISESGLRACITDKCPHLRRRMPGRVLYRKTPPPTQGIAKTVTTIRVEGYITHPTRQHSKSQYAS